MAWPVVISRKQYDTRAECRTTENFEHAFCLIIVSATLSSSVICLLVSFCLCHFFIIFMKSLNKKNNYIAHNFVFSEFLVWEPCNFYVYNFLSETLLIRCWKLGYMNARGVSFPIHLLSPFRVINFHFHASQNKQTNLKKTLLRTKMNFKRPSSNNTVRV
jgi:hypothetical protein